MRHLPADFEEVMNGVGGPARTICSVYSGQRATLSVRPPLPPHLIQGLWSLSSQAFVLAVILACFHVGVVGSGNPNSAPTHLVLASPFSIELSPQLVNLRL